MSSDQSGDQSGVSDFAHLHLHSQYSLLDGAIRIRDLSSTVLSRGMKAVALTDHGNMFGAIQFYRDAKKHGVKPIFGCEVYVSETDCTEKVNRKDFHLVLLAENEVGYKNLQRLVSFGHLRGFYYHPRIDRKLLREHSEGLIGLSSCIDGHISKLILNNDVDRARETAKEYQQIFAKGRYFLELQPNGSPAQEQINPVLAQFGEELQIPLVATADCHYIDPQEAEAHEVLTCMGLGRTFDDPNRRRRASQAFYIQRPEEMQRYFTRYPSAFENACEIAKMCKVELELDQPELPDFSVPKEVEEDLPGYLRKISFDGLQERFNELRGHGFEPNEDAYRQRLEYELGIIIDMKFPGYFLIVWDFIRYAKGQKVAVGPGRGSGAGSLVAYALRITDLDPLQYKLLFERFLNPERVSMPDFDIDFCMDRREEVIRYVTERYGEDRVGQIATFHSLKARGLVRDVCRVMGVPVGESSDLAKCIPEGPKVNLSMCMSDPAQLKKAAGKKPQGAAADAIAIAEASSKLRERAEQDPKIAHILEIGMKLEGLYRHAGMHAAGIVIGNRPLWEHVPCFLADGKIVTQYTMTDVETAGLVKFDFLGLKTLTVIQAAVRLINQLRDENNPLDLQMIPMDDAGVFEMISRGDTTGVFQLESSGFKDLLKKLKPDCFEDIVAAVALYRPGPLEGGMVDQFIECKHGRREIEYPHPLLAQILQETYGVFVYQEQVMQAAQILAGFSLGTADLMRRAMGKKKQAEMDRQRELFVQGCHSVNQISAAQANAIFDLIDKFAGYGFNKSHSAAYGLITYQTAYLKHRYPVAFMAGLMTCDKDKIDNIVKFIGEAREMGIEVLGPCVNASNDDFSIVAREDGSEAIRFGLGAVRNVGGQAVESIVVEREASGPYLSLFDCCRRVDLRKVNKRTLEGLVYAGAFDTILCGHERAQLCAAVGLAIDQGQSSQRDRESGQAGLFDSVAKEDAIYHEEYPEVEAWSAKQHLGFERDALGFYLTGHPLDRFETEIKRFATVNSGDLRKEHVGTEVTLGGAIGELRVVTTKAGKTMAFFQLEDQFGRIETVIFPKTFAREINEESGESLGEWLQRSDDDPVFVTGKLEADVNEEGEVVRYKVLADKIRKISEVRESSSKAILLELDASELDDERILRLKQIVANHHGDCLMELKVSVEERFETRMVFGDQYRVRVDDSLFESLQRLFRRPVAHSVAKTS